MNERAKPKYHIVVWGARDKIGGTEEVHEDGIITADDKATADAWLAQNDAHAMADGGDRFVLGDGSFAAVIKGHLRKLKVTVGVL